MHTFKDEENATYPNIEQLHRVKLYKFMPFNNDPNFK